MRYMPIILSVISVSLLSGCAPKLRDINTPYVNESFIPSSKAPDPIDRFQLPVAKDDSVVMTSSSFGDNPELLKAYQHYLKTGQAQNVTGDGIQTLAYDPYKKPLLTCAPLQMCQVILQKGEIIQDILVGDSTHWIVSKAAIGKGDETSWMVSIKPTVLNMATDLSITTDKRIYRFKLLAKAGTSPTVNFWYARETLDNAVANARVSASQERLKRRNIVANIGTRVDVNHLNFNYKLSGDNPSWSPNQVFDDGDKTFIRFPAIVDREALPVLFVEKNGKRALVNSRYKRPYMIVDGLFNKAVLISGKGRNKTALTIINASGRV